MDDPPTLPGIAYNQRNAVNITNPTQEPAGNVFTQGHGNLNDTEYDINISTTVGDILYTYHTSSDPPSGLRLKPEDVSNPDKVGYIEFNNYFDSLISCPDNFYPEGGVIEFRSAINQANQKIDSLITHLQYLVDEGSTDTLRSTVENSTTEQSFEIYQELMSASPYLSDSVVKSSIEKEEVLPNAMIRDIMVANPQSAKNEELLTSLDERADPMPDSMWVDILQGMEIIGAMERLISELDGWMQRKDLYFNELAELFLADTTNQQHSDSLISHYLNDKRLSSRYLLAQYYLANHDYVQANSIIQNIPSQFDLTEMQTDIHQRVISLMIIFPKVFVDSLGYIVPDSSQSILLEQLAQNDYNFPGAWTRDILIAVGLMNYEEPIVSESTFKSSRKSRYHWTNSHLITSDLKVFPNPARDFIIIEYNKSNKEDQTQILIINSQGIKIDSYFLGKNQDQKIISTGGMQSGTYIIQLLVNGCAKESKKVIITR